jgi:hypothetical protein
MRFGGQTVRARFAVAVGVLLPLVALQGCSGSGVKYAPVSGKVTMDGKPLAKVNVIFIPLPTPGSDVAGDTAGGVTDENGQYTLKTSTHDGMKDGAQVGKHKVSISLQESRGEGDRAIVREKLPKRYNQDTELKADVTPDSNHIDFDLKSH